MKTLWLWLAKRLIGGKGANGAKKQSRTAQTGKGVAASNATGQTKVWPFPGNLLPQGEGIFVPASGKSGPPEFALVQG